MKLVNNIAGAITGLMSPGGGQQPFGQRLKGFGDKFLDVIGGLVNNDRYPYFGIGGSTDPYWQKEFDEQKRQFEVSRNDAYHWNEQNIAVTDRHRRENWARDDTALQRMVTDARQAGINPLHLINQGSGGAGNTAGHGHSGFISTSGHRTGSVAQKHHEVHNMIGLLDVIRKWLQEKGGQVAGAVTGGAG